MPLLGGSCSSVGDVGVVWNRDRASTATLAIWDKLVPHLYSSGTISLGQREAAALICASEVRAAPSRARIPSGPLPSLGLA